MKLNKATAKNLVSKVPFKWIILLVVIVVSIVIAAYVKKSLSIENFEEGDKQIILVSVPWCGHCNALKPKWEAAKPMIKNCKVVELDGDTDAGKEVMAKYGWSGFPTIAKIDKTVSAEPVLYNGTREPEDIASFASN